MLRALRFISPKVASHAPSTEKEYEAVTLEAILLEKTFLAMDLVMDGQLDQSTKLLENIQGVFPKIGFGVLHFLEASIGFEAECIRKATSTLGAAESAAQTARSQAQDSGLKTSSFLPGTEYELVTIEASLLGAVSLFISESLIDTARALFKLRKTYSLLEKLTKHVESTEASTYAHPDPSLYPEQGLLEFRELRKKRLGLEDDSNVFPHQSIEEYIISGVKACAGLLNLVLTLIPPNGARLLSMVGYRGDRERGLTMLWDAIQGYENVHGAMSLLALLMFFDGPTQFSDITLSKEEEAAIDMKYGCSSASSLHHKTTAKMTPGELQMIQDKLRVALVKTRAKYRRGVIWLLMYGRMVAFSEDLEKGVEILGSEECGPNQMKQVEGLRIFDKCILLISLHRFEEAIENLERMPALSSWSHGLYMYLIAACHIELYRANKDTETGNCHKELANEYLAKTTKVTERKMFLAKPMPFDQFVIRKCAIFEKAAAEHNIEPADAVGTSPVLEAVYFWNGHMRTPQHLIEKSLSMLDYSAEHNSTSLPEDEANEFTRKLFTSVYLRRSDQSDDGLEMLESLLPRVISPFTPPSVPSSVRYYQQGEPWAGAVALYERAIHAWVRHGRAGASETHKWLKLAADWSEDYELSTRVNMKIVAARDRLGVYRA